MADTLAVYKTKSFARFARKAKIDDPTLWQAANAANSGQIDADLGGGIIKQRIARMGQGKSGGSRSIILLSRNERAFFVFGFEKKDQANIEKADLIAFRELAELLLDMPERELELRVEQGVYLAIKPSKEKADA